MPTRVVIAASIPGPLYHFVVIFIGAVIYALRAYYRTNNGGTPSTAILLALRSSARSYERSPSPDSANAGDTHRLGRPDPRLARDHAAKTAGTRSSKTRHGDPNGVEQGKTIAEPLRDSKVFPNMVVR